MSRKTTGFQDQHTLQLDIFKHREHTSSQSPKKMTSTQGLSSTIQSQNMKMTQISQKTKFSSHPDPQWATEIRQGAVEMAIQKCKFQYQWKNWDDLYLQTYGKSAHGGYKGGFTQVIRTFKGFTNTLKENCDVCPQIMNKAWEQLQSEAQN